MKAAILQPNYLPWRGYFDIINKADVLIVYDDVQYTVRDWRNRNKIKTPTGLQWITVPVKHDHQNQLINQTRIDYSHDWRGTHERTILRNYSRSSYIDDVMKILIHAYEDSYLYISELNYRLINEICRYLGINTRICLSSEFNIHGVKTDRLIKLLKYVGADEYISGPSAKSYIDINQFRESKIKLHYMRYRYPEYSQSWSEFVDGVSIIDVIANNGMQSKDYINSLDPMELAV